MLLGSAGEPTLSTHTGQIVYPISLNDIGNKYAKPQWASVYLTAVLRRLALTLTYAGHNDFSVYGFALASYTTQKIIYIEYPEMSELREFYRPE